MLPFLKNKEDVAIAEPVELEEDYGPLDAVADDVLEAISKKDKSLLKAALESLCDYVGAQDIEQDEELLTKEGI